MQISENRNENSRQIKRYKFREKSSFDRKLIDFLKNYAKVLIEFAVDGKIKKTIFL